MQENKSNVAVVVVGGGIASGDVDVVVGGLIAVDVASLVAAS